MRETQDASAAWRLASAQEMNMPTSQDESNKKHPADSASSHSNDTETPEAAKKPKLREFCTPCTIFWWFILIVGAAAALIYSAVNLETPGNKRAAKLCYVVYAEFLISYFRQLVQWGHRLGRFGEGGVAFFQFLLCACFALLCAPIFVI
jgi:hypothetical protein